MNKHFLEHEAIVSQPFGENTFLLWREGASDCLVIDPGFEPDKIQDRLQALKLCPVANLNTHGHSDHIAGNAFIKEHWPDCPLIIGAGDAEKLTDPAKNLSAGYGLNLISPPADRVVHEGDRLEFAGIILRVMETPGHSAGHVVFLCEQTQPGMLLGGDVLFHQGIGRSDFPDGDHQQLLDSIQQKLYTLPDDTIVLPGHGPPTTIGFEKQHNPFVQG